MAHILILIATTLVALFLIFYYGLRTTKSRRQRDDHLQAILAKPDQAPYIWYETEQVRDCLEGTLHFKNDKGEHVLLADRYEIFATWFLLQQAGIKVNALSVKE